MNHIQKSERIKVIYLMGMARSGGTIVGKILGQLENATFVGELRHLIKRGYKENSECSCGSKFNQCNYWNKIFKDTLLNNNQIDISNYIKIQESFDRTTMILKSFMIFFKEKVFNIKNNNYEIYKDLNNKLYSNISKSFNAKIIVESSRYPSRALMLSRCKNLEVYIIHLVRDPRGVINSQLKKQQERIGRRSLIALRNIFNWNITLLIGLLIQLIKNKKASFLSYENFITAPKESLNKILNEAKINSKTLPEISDANSVYIKPVHVFSGNENRFLSGETKIRQDVKWKMELHWFTKFVVSLLTSHYLLLQDIFKYYWKKNEKFLYNN